MGTGATHIPLKIVITAYFSGRNGRSLDGAGLLEKKNLLTKEETQPASRGKRVSVGSSTAGASAPPISFGPSSRAAEAVSGPLNRRSAAFRSGREQRFWRFHSEENRQRERGQRSHALNVRLGTNEFRSLNTGRRRRRRRRSL